MSELHETKLEDCKPSTSKIKEEIKSEVTDNVTKDRNELQYFDCALCGLREKYEYFGKKPPFQKGYILLEDSYVIEDPFVPPKQGEVLVLGSHCSNCRKMVCKDTTCSIYYNKTFCITCAKQRINEFPNVLKEKLNKIIR